MCGFLSYFIGIIHNRDTGLQDTLAVIVDGQTGIVYCLLTSGEFAIDRYRPRKVGAITTVLCAKIHQDQFAIFALFAITNVVQCSGPVATGNDAAISRTGSPLTQKRMEDFRFNFVFHYSGLNEFQQTAECAICNINSFLQHFHFGCGFNGPQFFHDLSRPQVLMQRVKALHFINEAIVP